MDGERISALHLHSYPPWAQRVAGRVRKKRVVPESSIREVALAGEEKQFSIFISSGSRTYSAHLHYKPTVGV